jgi:hypothetical protein
MLTCLVAVGASFAWSLEEDVKVETNGFDFELNRRERAYRHLRGVPFSWWIGREIIREEVAATLEKARSVAE